MRQEQPPRERRAVAINAVKKITKKNFKVIQADRRIGAPEYCLPITDKNSAGKVDLARSSENLHYSLILSC
jgi:hypothetical protein